MDRYLGLIIRSNHYGENVISCEILLYISKNNKKTTKKCVLKKRVVHTKCFIEVNFILNENGNANDLYFRRWDPQLIVFPLRINKYRMKNS